MIGEHWAPSARPAAVRSRKVADLVAARLRKMIARGELKENDWLPTEPELMTQFGVSRPTLREAFRLLEGDRLIQIRRGPPGGARVTLPGPEAAAPLFGLVLTLSGTTLADVQAARLVLEPPAVRLLAERGTPADVTALQSALDDIRAVDGGPELFARAATRFHVLLVRLAGNHTIAAVVCMLTEITTRHIALGYRESRRSPEELSRNNARLIRAYAKLIDLVAAGRGEDAENFWREHMVAVLAVLAEEFGADRDVVDVID
jgi:DNA-binding FadR family transcriptional regulator